jgi:hypothetical protein
MRIKDFRSTTLDVANPLGVKTFQFPTYCLLWAMPSIALWRPSVKRFNRFKSARISEAT